MTIYALTRYSKGHERGHQGGTDKFDDNVTIDFLIKHFQMEVNRVNNTNDSIVLFMQELVENEDGTPKLNSEGKQELKSIYVDKQYLVDLSNI